MDLKVIRGMVRYNSTRFSTGDVISDVDSDIADFLLAEGVVEVNATSLTEESAEKEESTLPESDQETSDTTEICEAGSEEEAGPSTSMPEPEINTEPQRPRRTARSSR